MKTTSVFGALLESGARNGKDMVSQGFEPFYRDAGDGLIRLAGWEKPIFFKIDGQAYRILDIRMERDVNRPGFYRGVVDFTAGVQEVGSMLSEPQDILEVFPLNWVKHGNGRRVEGPWKQDANGVFDEIDEPSSKVVRKVFDAIDKRHERMMPVFDIWKAVPATVSVRRQDDGTMSKEQISAHVEKLADHVKGDTFRDAVDRWTRENKRSGIGTSMEGVFLDGCRCFPSEEEAAQWLNITTLKGMMPLAKEDKTK